MLCNTRRHFLEGSGSERVLDAILILLMVFSICPGSAPCKTQNPSPLEVRIAQPLLWANDCVTNLGTHYLADSSAVGKTALLRVSVDRTNRSTEIVYLPEEDVDIDLSVIQVESLSAGREEKKWLPLYGPLHDMKPGWGAHPLMPGETKHLNLCFYNTTSVVNLKEAEGRRIQLRGKLRIRSWYFPGIEDWKRNEAAHKKRNSLNDSWDATLDPHEVTLEVDIPCSGTGCRPNCNVPQWILPGEVASIIDISAKSDQGAAINRELAHKFPACAENNSAY